MSMTEFQKLQSCLNSQLVEQRTLKVKPSSPQSPFSQLLGFNIKSSILDSNTQESEEKCHYEQYSEKNSYPSNNYVSPNHNSGCWSFIQALSNTSQNPKEVVDTEKSSFYPEVKYSLSQRSLELCTENLGSETGSDMFESSIFSSSLLGSNGGDYPMRDQPKSRRSSRLEKQNSPNFPPPLTTLSGYEPLEIRPHREDGRLVMKAVAASSPHSYFQAERSDGRLRLCLLNYRAHDFDSEDAAEESEGENGDSERDSFENGGETAEKEEEEQDYAEEEGEEDCDGCLRVGVDSASLDFGVEMGMKKFHRPSRCKAGRCGEEKLLTWESFWVATS
ncbi:protein FANTASTIC FOUR 3-like [Malania oleifera]|uniref:protein FANTASTIC FOUR 3-like n=1 Tax=Malania oleifera TaxID=397392 RepID=UPI0025AE80C6|nr:protein FANTASTIC FOUR 3-like [Malania oleifera]